MRPGDLVECVNVSALSGCHNSNLHRLVLGQVYTVRDVDPMCGGIRLAEIVNARHVILAERARF